VEHAAKTFDARPRDACRLVEQLCGNAGQSRLDQRHRPRTKGRDGERQRNRNRSLERAGADGIRDDLYRRDDLACCNARAARAKPCRPNACMR
jgi:hypothetical protein